MADDRRTIDRTTDRIPNGRTEPRAQASLPGAPPPLEVAIDAMPASSRDARDPARESREAHTREASARQEHNTYRPPSRLPDPYPSDIYVYRWVRASTLGKPDDGNMWQRKSEGWEFCSASDVPEVAGPLGLDPKTDVIEVGGLILCRATRDKMLARQKYYENLAASQMQSVDTGLMRNSDARMPILKPERSSQVTMRRSR